MNEQVTDLAPGVWSLAKLPLTISLVGLFFCPRKCLIFALSSRLRTVSFLVTFCQRFAVTLLWPVKKGQNACWQCWRQLRLQGVWAEQESGHLVDWQESTQELLWGQVCKEAPVKMLFLEGTKWNLHLNTDPNPATWDRRMSWKHAGLGGKAGSTRDPISHSLCELG